MEPTTTPADALDAHNDTTTQPNADNPPSDARPPEGGQKSPQPTGRATAQQAARTPQVVLEKNILFTRKGGRSKVQGHREQFRVRAWR